MHEDLKCDLIQGNTTEALRDKLLESFAKEEDSSDKKKILAMLPTDVGEGYKTIWNNL